MIVPKGFLPSEDQGRFMIATEAAQGIGYDEMVRHQLQIGEIVATHIIARPHVNVDLVLPLGRKGEVEKELQSRGGK